MKIVIVSLAVALIRDILIKFYFNKRETTW